MWLCRQVMRRLAAQMYKRKREKICGSRVVDNVCLGMRRVEVVLRYRSSTYRIGMPLCFRPSLVVYS